MAAPTIIPKSSYYDGPVTESDRAKGRAGAPDFTVYGSEDLKLSAHPTIPFALVVKKGKAAAYGVTAFVESSTGSDLVVQCDSQTSGTRWDIITVRYDWRPELGGPSDIRATNAGGKQIPTGLENTPGTLVDQPVWLVRWTGSSSTPAEYVDLRCFAGNGGMMANNTLALGYLKKPGACVRIGDAFWSYREIENQQWDWREPSALVNMSAPTGWTVGPAGFYVTRTPLAGGKFLINLSGQLVRQDAAFAIGNRPLGAVIPAGYRPLDSLDFHAGMNTDDNLYLGSFSLRVTAGGTTVLNAINANYIIERFGNINFSGHWVI